MFGKKQSLRWISVDAIRENPAQPRRDIRYDKLLELSQSIAENGVLCPLSVTVENGRATLIAGERRLRAAKLAGLKSVPCYVLDIDEQQRAVLALVENLQREDMSCFEVAEGIRRLIDIYGLTQEEAARRLGCAQSTVANRLRLLRLTPEERQVIADKGLTERHARALLRLEDEALRKRTLVRVIERSLTVAQTEQVVDALAAPRAARHAKPLLKDVRLFINTVNHAVEAMKEAGVPARAEKTETESYIQYVVTIPKEPAPLAANA